MEKAKPATRKVAVLEVIATSVSDAVEAQQGGADRLEVIRDLSQGGLTPPLDLVQDILDAVHIPVRVMLRETNSYEVKSKAEIEHLGEVAKRLATLSIEGVVIGFLRGREIDTALTEQVLSFAPNLRATFHHAFDETEEPLKAIRILKKMKQIDRILTSAGNQEWPGKIVTLSRYVKEAGPEIKVLAGGGMDERSIPLIFHGTSVREFHVGRAARVPASVTGAVQSERVKTLVELIQERVELKQTQ